MELNASTNSWRNTTVSDHSYSSGINSPDLFLDDDDDPEVEAAETIRRICQNSCRSLESTLRGVPPPPSVTISQLTVPEILTLYNANLAEFTRVDGESVVSESSSSSPPVPRRTRTHWIGGSRPEEMASGGDRRLMVVSRFYDTYYNSTPHSEALDGLLVRYLARYVGCETASSCVAAVSSCKSPLKRTLRQAAKPSPGKRLSHLARRRIAACTADNFKEVTFNRNTRFVDRKKFAAAASETSDRRKSPRLKRTPKKTAPPRRTPDGRGSAKKITPRRTVTPRSGRRKTGAETVDAAAGGLTGRALFFSPETSRDGPTVAEVAVTRSKRALFVSPVKGDGPPSAASEEPRKRTKLDGILAEGDTKTKRSTALVQKSLSFSGDGTDGASDGRRSIARCASENFPERFTMSDLHRRKLLWAVTEALKSHGVGMKHDNFRHLMTSLARLTGKLCQLTRRTSHSSTSETFLRIAREHSRSLMEGRKVEDILAEERFRLIGEDCENSYGAKRLGRPGGESASVLRDRAVNVRPRPDRVDDRKRPR